MNRLWWLPGILRLSAGLVLIAYSVRFLLAEERRRIHPAFLLAFGILWIVLGIVSLRRRRPKGP